MNFLKVYYFMVALVCVQLFCTIEYVPRHQQHWNVPSDDSSVIMRRYLMMAVAVVFLIVMVIVLLTRVGRGVADRDPSLDWRMNPNLRTGD